MCFFYSVPREELNQKRTRILVGSGLTSHNSNSKSGGEDRHLCSTKGEERRWVFKFQGRGYSKGRSSLLTILGRNKEHSKPPNPLVGLRGVGVFLNLERGGDGVLYYFLNPEGE